MHTINFELTSEEANYLMQVMAKQPYQECCGLMDKFITIVNQDIREKEQAKINEAIQLREMMNKSDLKK